MHKFWSVVFGVVIFFAAALFAVAFFVPGWWLPRNVSTVGGTLDGLFYLIFWITTFFFVLTEGLLIYNLWRFGEHNPARKAPHVHGNHRLEMVWTVVPAIILVFISLVQLGTWMDIKYLSHAPPVDGSLQQMVVVARQWEWRVRYPSPQEYRRWEQVRPEEGPVAWQRMASYVFEDLSQFDDVHVPNEIHCYCQNDRQKSARVLIHLRTRDVLHSLFLPHIRIKQDAVPGRVIPVWFEVTDWNYHWDRQRKEWAYRRDETGSSLPFEWDLACAEFCGSRHSMMRGRLLIHPNREDFLSWLETAQQAQNVGKTGAN